MSIFKDFKPNLIPNSKVDNPINLENIIGDNVSQYILSAKKDGCRIIFKDGEILSRELKTVSSKWIQNTFKELAQVCKLHGIILEGEFYSHEMKFNEIVRYFKTEDVTAAANVQKLKKLEAKGQLEEEWPGRSAEWLSTYHPSLKVWMFDFIANAMPDAKYHERVLWLIGSLQPGGLFYDFRHLLELGPWYNVFSGYATPEYPAISTYTELTALYENLLSDGYEGLVIANRNRTYKFNRSTAKDNHLFKMKEDKLQYDGQVIDIVEGTVAREGSARTVNALGRSKTSQLQEDREPSGMAKGILTEYDGHRLVVSLEGFTHANLKDILERKNEYIGEWFRYTGMAPVKNVPRHSHASKNSMWRDAK